MTDTGTPPDSEAGLIAGIRTGDRAAWRDFVTRYEGEVAAVVVGMLGRGPDADDVGQEVFIRFYRNLPAFREEARVSTYLTRIAINLSLNALKRRSRMRRWFAGPPDEWLPATGPAPDDTAAARLDADVVSVAVRRLPAEQRAVTVLRLVRGLSTRETATALGIPEGTVLSRLSRAQKRLRAELAPVLDR